MEDKEIAVLLREAAFSIENNEIGGVANRLAELTSNHLELVDERLTAEIQILLYQMEYKKALNQYTYLRFHAVAYKYCEKMYSWAGEGLKCREKKEELKDADKIWWCWLQGLEKAPDVVAMCYRSLSKLGKEVIVLTEDNINQYIQLPDYIKEKYKSGVIGRAHYTDLVRLELLTRRGGTWIDSTAWISGSERLKAVIDQENLFMFKSGYVSPHIVFDNWFIHSKRESCILEATKRMLYEFWKNENEARDYFIFHVIMALACKMYPEENDSIPLFSTEPCHVLQYELLKGYSKNRFDQIKGMSDIHKLTYKVDGSGKKGTFLEWLLNNE